MVKYSKGDVLNCKATLVAHQVNAFGVMGGGIAAAIWPLLTRNLRMPMWRNAATTQSSP